MKKILFLLIFILFFIGCGVNTGIVKITDDTYLIARQDGSTWSGAKIKIELYKEAVEHCAKMGKKFVQVSQSSNDALLYQSYAGAEIQFKCE